MSSLSCFSFSIKLTKGLNRFPIHPSQRDLYPPTSRRSPHVSFSSALATAANGAPPPTTGRIRRRGARSSSPSRTWTTTRPTTTTTTWPRSAKNVITRTMRPSGMATACGARKRMRASWHCRGCLNEGNTLCQGIQQKLDAIRAEQLKGAGRQAHRMIKEKRKRQQEEERRP